LKTKVFISSITISNVRGGVWRLSYGSDWL